MNRLQRHLGKFGGRLGRLGQGAGSNSDFPNLPDFNDREWSDYQKVFAQSLAQSVSGAPPYVHPDLTFFLPPADAKAFILTPTIFPAYPAPGAAATTILSYVPPVGQVAVINKLAIVSWSGNPPDGQGTVIWAVTVNGAGVTGLNQLTSQVGTYANPNDTEILIIEGDVLAITVQVVATAAPINGTTAARIAGWKYPISEALLPQLA